MLKRDYKIKKLSNGGYDIPDLIVGVMFALTFLLVFAALATDFVLVRHFIH